MADATIILRYSLLWSQSNNSIIARPVALGTWNVLRVGFLHSVRQDTLVGITPDFFFGLSAGTASVYGDASATHSVGAQSTGAWTLGGDNFLSTAIRPVKQVGVTKTSGTNLAAGWITYANTVADMKRSMTILTITKGSPNYSFKMFYRNSGAASSPTFADLTAQMEAGIPAFASHLDSSTQTLAVDEGADGTLTALQMYWSLTTSSMEIEGVMVSKVS